MNKALDIVKYIILFVGIAFMLMAAQLAQAAVDVTDVPVLKKTIKAGEVVTETMLTTKPLPTQRLARTAIRDENEIIGMEAVRTTKGGVPLFYNSFRIPPMMRKGQTVSITYQKPMLSLTMEGKALSDGNLGEAIQVIGTQSKRVLTGKVIAANVVIVK